MSSKRNWVNTRALIILQLKENQNRVVEDKGMEPCVIQSRKAQLLHVL